MITGAHHFVLCIIICLHLILINDASLMKIAAWQFCCLPKYQCF